MYFINEINLNFKRSADGVVLFKSFVGDDGTFNLGDVDDSNGNFVDGVGLFMWADTDGDGMCNLDDAGDGNGILEDGDGFFNWADVDDKATFKLADVGDGNGSKIEDGDGLFDCAETTFK